MQNEQLVIILDYLLPGYFNKVNFVVVPNDLAQKIIEFCVKSSKHLKPRYRLQDILLYLIKGRLLFSVTGTLSQVQLKFGYNNFEDLSDALYVILISLGKSQHSGYYFD